MDKKAFKQRMQNLKAYRESNPGKTYLDWKVSAFADGGEVPPTNRPEPIERIPYKGKLYTDKYGQKYTEEQYYDYINNSTDEISKFDNRPMVRGLKPITNLEDVANFTPIGDVIAINDTYQAIKNDDWLGAGLAALTMIPFVPTTVKNFRKKSKIVYPNRPIPTVNKAAQEDAINRVMSRNNDKIALHERALKDRDMEYENWIENEDAFRRAVDFDKKYGTNYVKAYTDELKNYAKGSKSNDLTQIGIKSMSQEGSFDPAIPNYIFISSDQIGQAKPNPGLINHELGHRIDKQAGVIDNYGQISIPIFDKSKFESPRRLKQLYPKTYDKIQNYLLNDSEIKSHMNAFRTYLRDNNMLNNNGKETLNSFKRKLFNSDFDNLKKIFNSYKSGKQFIQDFNMVPVTRIDDNNNLV